MAAVQQGPWRGLSSGKKVTLAAAGLSVGLTVGYLVYRRIRSSSSGRQKTAQSRYSIPLDVYRSISRHQSAFLDLVSQKSGAQVSVAADLENPSTICFFLQGKPEQVLLAECVLEQLATDSQIITDVLEVPQSAFGRIIGRGGETVKLISRMSGARVNCSRERDKGLDDKGNVVITGTRHEVQSAKDMIMEKVNENESVRKRISQSSALRNKRKDLESAPRLDVLQNGQDLNSPLTEPGRARTDASTTGFTSSGDLTTENSLKSDDEEEPLSPLSPLDYCKFEIPSPDLSFQPGEHLEVYVSASENPQHFWIQIIGVRSLQLDKLTAEMTRYYNADNPQEHRVEALVVGDIVAAPYRDHGKWNRARVLGVLSSGLVDLYYVDFGDCGELARDQLRSMRSDFLSLPFQAIECSLAGVQPAGELWTEDALDDFEKMTYCGQWTPLLAKLCSYSHTETFSWPSVKLYDKVQGMDVGEELIRLGHALSIQDEGNVLKEDQDEPRSLQKLLDEMTGATSELSLSCISLSGPAHSWDSRQWFCSSSCSTSVEVLRGDVDSSGDMVGTSVSMVCSTPSLNLSELVSCVLKSSSPNGSPPDRDLRATSESFLHHLPESEVKPLLSSSSPVDGVTSALDAVTLSDDVFVSGSSVNQSSSSDGIRSVWYYLTSSQDSTGASLDTTASSSTRPRSSTDYPSESGETTPETSCSNVRSDLTSGSSESFETAGILNGEDTSSSDSRVCGSDVREPLSERNDLKKQMNVIKENMVEKKRKVHGASGWRERIMPDQASEVASISGSVDDVLDEDFN